MIVLLIGGVAFIVAGALAVGFGIPVNEFSFGNTLILSGAVSVCTGAILLALSMVVRELRTIRRGFDPTVTRARDFAGSSASSPLSDDRAGVDKRDAGPSLASPGGAPVSPASWQTEAAGREHDGLAGDASTSAEIPAVAAEPPPPETKRRNLLFSSTSRKERERAQAKADAGASLNPQQTTRPDNFAFDSTAPARTFDEAWPQGQSDVSARRTGRTTSTLAPPVSASATSPVAPSAVTVLKSGVVDGMAYSLYSDGSIEAQMPEGMMRFASIDELRSHLDQRQ